MAGLSLCLTFLIVFTWLSSSSALQYTVGNSYWFIPPSRDFFTNWSASHSFHIGDTLFFDFNSGTHNVMQVSKREYDACTFVNPFRTFSLGPAIVELMEEGVFYFICGVPNHCALGQKLSVTVQKRSSENTPSSPLSPSSQPDSPSVITPESQPPVPTAVPEDKGDSADGHFISMEYVWFLLATACGLFLKEVMGVSGHFF